MSMNRDPDGRLRSHSVSDDNVILPEIEVRTPSKTAERRKMQNRLAQRNHRSKKRTGELERTNEATSLPVFARSSSKELDLPRPTIPESSQCQVLSLSREEINSNFSMSFPWHDSFPQMSLEHSLAIQTPDLSQLEQLFQPLQSPHPDNTFPTYPELQIIPPYSAGRRPAPNHDLTTPISPVNLPGNTQEQNSIDSNFDVSSPDAKDANGRTALHKAGYNGHDGIVRLLIEKGAEIEARDASRQTTIHLAAAKGYLNIVKLLQERGANIDAQDSVGRTPLHRAVEKERERMVQLLLQSGANGHVKNKDGWTALHYAANNGSEAILWLLLEHGVDIETKDKWGQTALHQAAESGHELAVRLLLDKGADINIKTNIK